jgi:FdhD protein
MMSVKKSRLMDCWKLTAGKLSAAKTGVVTEQELTIYVNGSRLAAASITPTFEKEFVVGYLFGQGFINNIEELASIEIQTNTAQVTLKDNQKTLTGTGKTNYRIVSGGGRSAYFEDAGSRKIMSDTVIRKQDIYAAMNTLFKSAGLYGETEGVHAAGLFASKADLICMVEDIGRHNTLDKIIGFALLNKIDCSETFLVSTGRMASEMVTKICRCGIPIVATKTAVTDKGLEIGKKCGLTIIGFVRDKGTKINTDMDVRVIEAASMRIYSGAARVLCE